MSWGISANGNIEDVRAELKRQITTGPLADKPAGLSDDSERDTVIGIGAVINQILDTYTPAEGVATGSAVSVSANGHMGYANWDLKTGAYQVVALKIDPVSEVR